MPPFLTRIHRHPTARTALLVALALAIPLFLYGPWVPFTDLIGFCGLDSFPPSLSYGPYHYYVFQFTYILPHALSRAFMDLGMGPRVQVPLFYFAQMAAFLFVTWRLLDMFVASVVWRRIFLILGGISAWDGLFLWGGPFAYSMAAALLALATYYSLREAASPERTAHWPTALLALLAVASHPFALPFALMLFGARILFLRRSRWHAALLILLLLLYQVIITRENPEPIPGPILSQLFSWYPQALLERFQQLFDWNSETVDLLFSAQPTALVIYFIGLGIIRIVGFLASPIVALRPGTPPALRMLALLNTGVFVLYLFSRDSTLISMWPQRILTFHSYLTYVCGVALPLALLQNWQARRKTDRPVSSRPWLSPALEGAALLFLIAVQLPLMSLGRVVEENFQHAKQQLLESGVRDAILITKVVNVQPFFVRSVPFLLFSDPDIIRRHLLIFTEWHAQPRHPTRLAEMTLPSSRPHYELLLAKARNGLLTLEISPLLNQPASPGPSAPPANH